MILLAPLLALADVVGPPVEGDCPDGSRLVSSHGGVEYCVLDTCAEDAECSTAGTTCVPKKMCVSSGYAAAATCGDCPDHGSCEEVKVCAADAGGCGCSAAGSPMLALWPLLALFVRRRGR